MKDQLSNFDLLKEIERLKTELAETKTDLRIMGQDYDNLMELLPHLESYETIAKEFQISVQTLYELVGKNLIPHYVWCNNGEKSVYFCHKEVTSFFGNNAIVPKWQVPIQQAS